MVTMRASNNPYKPPSRSLPKRAVRSRKPAKQTLAVRWVVAIGASAGGFDAIIQLLRVMPAAGGAAYIVLHHLKPSAQSLSAELYSRHTTMAVRPAVDGMKLDADCVYTVPPGQEVRVSQGCIQLSAPVEGRRLRLPVDTLFRSLGEDQRERAIAIVLSGTGNDGTLGLKDVVANGGMVLVQDPNTAQFDEMPRSAVETGLVTHVLPVAQMPRAILTRARPGERRFARPPRTPDTLHLVASILALLQEDDGQRFTGYKQPLLARRIERRMGLMNIDTLEAYATRLRSDSAEVSALRKDLLAGETEFFRDPDAWAALNTEVLRPMVAAKEAGASIRAWVVGAGAGEEAYTLAILILSRLRQARKGCRVQIFATDNNSQALKIARTGRYPAGIAKQVRAAYLKRYFTETKDDDQYQVVPELRDSIAFAEHDWTADPPFSRLDLMICRNLLVTGNRQNQNRNLLLYRFALRPGGHLFLGRMESGTELGAQFRAVARPAPIYQHIDTTAPIPIDEHGAAPRPLKPVSRALGAAHLGQFASMTRKALFNRFASAVVLIDGTGKTLYTSGTIERFLLPLRSPNGSFAARLPESIRVQWPEALTIAKNSEDRVEIIGASDHKPARAITVELLPIQTESPSEESLHFVVAFDESRLHTGVDEASWTRMHLQQELHASQADFQSAVGQMEALNEELRVSREQMGLMNEEWQTTTEELESSKEELHSVNEELNAVNTQLQHKVKELEGVNTDLAGLLASNEVATVCLDRSLRIKWFTPAANRLFNLLATDIGRPISDLSLTVLDSALIDNAREVLQSRTPRTREFSFNGVYLRRIVPYMADSQLMAGIVITFTDITEAKKASQQEIEDKSRANVQLEEYVRKRTEELAILSRELALAEVRERQAIARDLHDGLGQELNAASIKLDALRSSEAAFSLQAPLDAIAQLIEGVVREMRSLTAQLNPPVLEQLGLVSAIEWLAEEMRRTYQLEVMLDDDCRPKPLDSIAASIVFRAVRELLINVARHAKVKRVHVTVRRLEDQMTVDIEDEGIGFVVRGSIARSDGGLGLATMRERIAYIGGHFEIASERNRGTSARIHMPMSR